jgi:ATP-dependent RNA helicase DeaD
MKAFSEMGLNPGVIDALKRMNFVNATDVQEQVVPIALKGRDMIVRAKTGTGKTGAFLISIYQMGQQGSGTESLIIAPTRELAIQIADVAGKLAPDRNRNIPVVYGGASINTQIQAIKRNPNMVIGTPGRVIDLIDRGVLKVGNIRFMVIDEADTMLDMGFIEDIEYILSKTPSTKQTLLFSATMPDKIIRVAENYMKNIFQLKVGDEDEIVVAKIKHFYAVSENRMKFATLLAYVKDYAPKKAIIFAQTQYAANALYEGMRKQKFDVVLMHGGLTQARRESELRRFRSGAQFLIATNVAARGIDIAGISDIINFDVPNDPHTYVHRVGRSARMDTDGRSFTIISSNQRDSVRDIEYIANIKMERINIDAGQFKDIIIFNRTEGTSREGRRMPHRGSFGGGRPAAGHTYRERSRDDGYRKDERSRDVRGSRFNSRRRY